MALLERHSPSSLNLFCAAPALWVLERVLERRQPVGVPAHRGSAVEAGIAKGLLTPSAPLSDCVEAAKRTYRIASALSADARRETYEATIEDMVRRGLDELRPYGVPSRQQAFVEWRPDGLKYPIVGYLDFAWDDHGIVVDLKTTEKLPARIKVTHARQVALYAGSDNVDARLTYVTPAKSATYRLENIREHRRALHRIALTVERFMALSADPRELVGIVCPDLESFYWAAPEARAAAFEIWGV